MSRVVRLQTMFSSDFMTEQWRYTVRAEVEGGGR